MAITDAQISDLRDAFHRIEALLQALLDTVETDDDELPTLTPWGEAELALELDHDEQRLVTRDAWAKLPLALTDDDEVPF